MEEAEVAMPLPPLSQVAALVEREVDLEAPEPVPPHHIHPQEAELAPPALPQPSNQNHHPPPPRRRRRPPQLRPEWLNLVMSFGFVAMSVRSQCQNSSCQSLSFHMACLCLALALAAFTVSKYIPANLEAMAQVLEHGGVLCGFTAFFLAITPNSPLFLVIISWAIYAVSIAVIIASRLDSF